MQTLLHDAQAAARGVDNSQDAGHRQLAWFRLIASKLQASGSAQGLAAAVAAHVQLLQQPAAVQAAGGAAAAALLSPPARSDAVAAACMSLGRLVSAITVQDWGRQQLTQQLGPGIAGTSWHALLQASVQRLPDAPACQAAGAAGAQLLSPQRLPGLACFAAAAAQQPGAPAPWRAFGDFLFDLASPAPGGEDEQQRLGQEQQRLMLGAAAEAYCSHLAAAVNARALPSADHCLGVLLRLLRLLQQHAPQLQLQLASALRRCPAAAWQGLTNQLLAQLQHREAAVRGLVQQLLQGLAVVAPCAVLYPLVVEVRGAREAGHEVRRGRPTEVLLRLKRAVCA
jgi:hypothetical protein